MKHIPQQRHALEKASSLDDSITSVRPQLSHSGDSVHMAEMRAATLPTRPLQDIRHWAAAKKKKNGRRHTSQLPREASWTAPPRKGVQGALVKGLCCATSTPFK